MSTCHKLQLTCFLCLGAFCTKPMISWWQRFWKRKRFICFVLGFFFFTFRDDHLLRSQVSKEHLISESKKSSYWDVFILIKQYLILSFIQIESPNCKRLKLGQLRNHKNILDLLRLVPFSVFLSAILAPGFSWYWKWFLPITVHFTFSYRLQ